MELTDIPSEVIIYVILPYLQYEYNKKSDINIKALFGYFKLDCNKIIWLIWRKSHCKVIENSEKLISFPFLTSLEIKNCKISELKEYPLLSSLKIYTPLAPCKVYKSKISELKEYPLLTFLEIWNSEISELKEYPILTSLKIDKSKINELKEFPLLTFLEIWISEISELKE